jgi:hypothetical protein
MILGFQEVKSDLWLCFFFEVRQVSILFIGLMLIMVILLSNMSFGYYNYLDPGKVFPAFFRWASFQFSARLKREHSSPDFNNPVV